jgi:predicted small lipoprotein YifL
MRALLLAVMLSVGLAACGYRTPLKLPQEKGKAPASSTAPESPESERP